MTTLADVVRRYGPAYRRAYHERLLPSHDAALNAIARCRTAALGGHVYTCTDCGTVRYSYHSCRNRHCPTCQHDAGQAWLAAQQDLLLPVPYFLVTFTLPAELRAFARANQRAFYNLFFRVSAAALQQLAGDPRFVGGQLGMVGVLQTWTRDLRYHPHIHYLVPAIGLAADGRWVRPARSELLVHVKPLGALVRGKMRAALGRLATGADIPAGAWQKHWVVDCRRVGSGATALKYLAPYVFRVGLSNNRLVRVANDQVTFQYTDGATRERKHCTLPALAFLHRFLQHVLPRGFVKVRRYGIFRPHYQAQLAQLRAQLALVGSQEPAEREAAPGTAGAGRARGAAPVDRCPQCGQTMQARVIAAVGGRGPPEVE